MEQRYNSGEEIHVGDRIRYAGDAGTIVFVIDLPPNSKDFVLIRNKAARRGVPEDFQAHCFTERYDESI
jgi:hypothetical protein